MKTKLFKNNDIDYWRQLDLFDPTEFETPIHIVGAGATGSYITYLLAKMGCKNVTVYDFDKVEAHNLPNQVYGLNDIGELKVSALKNVIKRDCGFELKTSSVEVKSLDGISGVVYVLTDSMKSRKAIWDSLKNNPKIELYIETRMGAEFGVIYSIIPLLDKAEYEKTLYTDEQAQQSACTRQSISPTVATISGVAVFSMIRHLNKDVNPSKTMISLLPPMMTTQTWRKNSSTVNNKTKKK